MIALILGVCLGLSLRYIAQNLTQRIKKLRAKREAVKKAKIQKLRDKREQELKLSYRLGYAQGLIDERQSGLEAYKSTEVLRPRSELVIYKIGTEE